MGLSQVGRKRLQPRTRPDCGRRKYRKVSNTFAVRNSAAARENSTVPTRKEEIKCRKQLRFGSLPCSKGDAGFPNQERSRLDVEQGRANT